MSEQNTPNLKIEDIINKTQSGDAKKNVLDFVDFLHANNFQMEYNPNEYYETYWSGAIGGVVGDSIGYMAVNGNPGTWNVWFNVFGFDENDPLDDEMKETVWSKLSPCGKCNDGWETCRGGEKMILGKTFDNLCHSPLCIIDPDTKTLENMQKLLLVLKQKKDNM